MNKKFFVISHTHWDREWYMPFESFRFKLCDLINRLIETIEKFPDYIFHLDAQTIVIEDYLYIYPDREGLLKEYIKSGNIVIGPWYMQNDFLLTSGESTVRNLLLGDALTKKYGGSSKVAYAPDQFGSPSQMPQIMTEFDSPMYIFGRGYTFFEKDEKGEVVYKPHPAEFMWEGADGTKILSVFLQHWYNNAQRIPSDLNKAKLLLDVNAKNFEHTNSTENILLMNGVDHLEAQDDLLPTLKGLTDIGYDVRQTSLEEFIDSVNYSIKRDGIKLSTYKGALMNGADYNLLRGCWSSKSYIKTANVEAQNMLESVLEPIYSIMESAGLKGSYDNDIFKMLWKELLKNHPHDSICCCSRDEVHYHMEDHYRQIKEMSGEILRRGLEQCALHLSCSNRQGQNYIIAAVNTTDAVTCGVIRQTVDIPQKENAAGLQIFDADGKEVDFTLLSVANTKRDVFSPVNLPGVLDVTSFEVEFNSGDVAPMAVKAFTAVPQIESSGKALTEAQSKVIAPILKMSENGKAVVENEYYLIEYNGGRVDVTVKSSGKKIIDAVSFEECADRGDSYQFIPTNDETIYSDYHSAQYSAQLVTSRSQSFTVKNKMQVPESFDFVTAKREGNAECEVNYTISLESQSKTIGLEYYVNNTAKDHRIRIVIDCGINSEIIYTDSAFNLEGHTQAEQCLKDNNFKGFCNATVAALSDGKRGMAVFSAGLHEVEKLQQKMAFTIVRSTGVICFGSGKAWDVPANQCLRGFSGKIGIMAFDGDIYSARLITSAKRFMTGLISVATSMDSKKYSGGRFAVQHSDLEELYYIKDKFADITIPQNMSMVSIDNPSIELTAFKKSFDGRSLVLRIFNVSDKSQTAKIAYNGTLRESGLNEKPKGILGSGEITVTLGAKKIKTYLLDPAK